MSASNIFPFFAFSVVAAWPVASVIKRWIGLREKQVEMLSAQTAEKAAQYAAKTDRLEQRVAVLERLLTDRSTVLADEIDRLRDQPIN